MPPVFRRSSAVEQLTVNQLVVGSIPTAGAKEDKHLETNTAPSSGEPFIWGNLGGTKRRAGAPSRRSRPSGAALLQGGHVSRTMTGLWRTHVLRRYFARPKTRRHILPISRERVPPRRKARQLCGFHQTRRKENQPPSEAPRWRCCRTQSVEDSHRESMRLDGSDDQASMRPLPHDGLEVLQ